MTNIYDTVYMDIYAIFISGLFNDAVSVNKIMQLQW